MLLLKVSQLALGLAWTVMTTSASPVTKEKRNTTTTDLVDTLMTELMLSFLSGVPVASANGTQLLETLLQPLDSNSTTALYTLPSDAPDLVNRTRDLAEVRKTFRYDGESYGGPHYPGGTLGVAKNALDVQNIETDLVSPISGATTDGKKTLKVESLKSLDDYIDLYNLWQHATPTGVDSGVATNYTHDLYFSMQRLSTSPYAVRRLRQSATLPFAVDDAVAEAIAGTTLTRLHRQGRLFYVDHRNQADLPKTERYAGACDAYFYLDATSSHFLPLAIRTKAESEGGLVYTPQDSAGDWLLAKMAFNVNDFWYAQWNHLAQTHLVVQIVWMAAIRTISHGHPIYAILDRLTYETFAISVLAQTILFASGAAVDRVFAFTGPSANNFTNDLYYQSSGKFQSNYLRADLRARGLIDACSGPPLPHFPFYEDAKVIHDAIHAFFTTFVRSYYKSDKDVAADRELQDWVAECNGRAEVLDFPEHIDRRDVLVDVLTHIAHLVSTAHHAVNTNELIQVSGVLPFNPASLYNPLPTAKSPDTNPVDFLPPLDKAIEHLVVGALFARPALVGSNRTLIHMFDDATMLTKLNLQTRAANSIFTDKMRAFSEVVQNRTFDAAGLSQGMPYLWKALDPNTAPYSITV